MDHFAIRSADPAEQSSLVRKQVTKIEVLSTSLNVTLRSLSNNESEGSESEPAGTALTIAWSRPSPVHKRDILGVNTGSTNSWMVSSLAFLAPDIVQAAIDGKLPRILAFLN
jgi:hypothetical protein